MYPASVRLFTQLLPFVALAIVGELAIQIAKEKMSSGSGLTFVSVLIWAYLAFYAHASLLLPDNRDKAEDNKRVFGFALRTFGLGFLMMIPVVIGVIAVFSQVFTATATAGSEITAFVEIGILLAVCFLIVFGLLGTLLPAFVADRGRGFSVAFSRGISQFLWTSGHFLAGPVLLFAVSYAISIGGLYAMDPHIDLLNASYIPNIPLFLILIVAYVIQALGTVMIAWVLSTAFLRAEGPA
ncbi:hypothetical protein [Pelagibius sp. Alg239-R121]|uniref:hypothetical protein n=1 Tax=Pelagibius sp. Alg239-R121 TaxID=2993448 RepID=UPI0024A66AD5|nr:hypothetical protein [Pelagibius sp. Alg239-R121]